METTLRPLTLGEILDRTAELYRSNFLLLAGISSVYAGILLVLSLVQIGAQQGARALHMNTGLIVVSVIGLVVLGLIIFVVGGLSIAANTRAVGWLHLGEPASIGAAYRAILPRTWRYLWLMTITYFRAWFPCVVIYAAYAALLLAYIHPKGLFAPHAPSPDPQDVDYFSRIDRCVSFPAPWFPGLWRPHELALRSRHTRLHGREPEGASGDPPQHPTQ